MASELLRSSHTLNNLLYLQLFLLPSNVGLYRYKVLKTKFIFAQILIGVTNRRIVRTHEVPTNCKRNYGKASLGRWREIEFGLSIDDVISGF
jgi:hypothetical protein